jgi:hypothetical protein
MPESASLEWVVPFATALSGAFAGASAAFWFDRITRRKEDRDRKITAGDQSLFAFHQQLQDMLTLYNHIGISGWSAPFAMIMSLVRIDRSSLIFLRRENPDDLNKIVEAERWYSDVCDALNDYNEKARVCNILQLQDARNANLVPLCNERNRAHDALIKTIRNGVKYNHISTRTLHRILTSMFKKVKFSVPGANKEIARQFDDLCREFDVATDEADKNRLRAEMDDLVFKLYMKKVPEDKS